MNLAKNKESRGGKIKINILQFELDGSDETLQEGLRTVAETLNRSLSPGQRVITQVQAPTRLALGNGAPIQEELNEQENEPEDEQLVVTTQARARSPRQYPKNDVHKILTTKLGIRNSAAHPSTVVITQVQAEDFITDLINNVVLKYT